MNNLQCLTNNHLRGLETIDSKGKVTTGSRSLGFAESLIWLLSFLYNFVDDLSHIRIFISNCTFCNEVVNPDSFDIFL